eukprot:8362668-Pyramimonas_sp.AAC.1
MPLDAGFGENSLFNRIPPLLRHSPIPKLVLTCDARGRRGLRIWHGWRIWCLLDLKVLFPSRSGFPNGRQQLLGVGGRANIGTRCSL